MPGRSPALRKPAPPAWVEWSQESVYAVEEGDDAEDEGIRSTSRGFWEIMTTVGGGPVSDNPVL